MSRLFPLAAAFMALAVPGAAVAAPVNPTPVVSATFDGPVRAAAYWGDVIYVAGDFTYARVNGLRHTRTRLAAVDARSGALLDWRPAANASVTAIAVDAGGVYVAGGFTYINGVKRDSLARLDLNSGAVKSGFHHKIYGHPRAIAVGHGRVYLGGTLTSVNDIPRGRVAAFDGATGALDTEWAPVLTDVALSILPAADRVYIGGRFDDVNGADGTQKLAAVHPATGAVVAGFTSRASSLVHDLTLNNGVLYAAIDGTGGRAMAMDAGSGEAKWTIQTDGDVQAIAVLGDTVYLGGHFDNVCNSANVGNKGVCLDGSTRRVKLAAVDMAGTLLPWVADGNGSVGVHTLMVNSAQTQLVAGGEFTRINGVDQRRFALFGLAP